MGLFDRSSGKETARDAQANRDADEQVDEDVVAAVERQEPPSPSDVALDAERQAVISAITTIDASTFDIAPSKIAEGARKDLVDSTGKPFINPAVYGGKWLDVATKTAGEPLNVIISALSSPEILEIDGLQNYLRSLKLDYECFRQHQGGPQKAFLDPRGLVDQNFLYREVYTVVDRVIGTCLESLFGGNHIRAWQQMGTGAWFFAASKEKNVTKHHMIVANGYDVGRDWVVQQSQTPKDGLTSFKSDKFQTSVQYLTGLLPPGASGINHDIATDGRVALLTVKLLTAHEKALLNPAAGKTNDDKTAVPKFKAAAKAPILRLRAMSNKKQNQQTAAASPEGGEAATVKPNRSNRFRIRTKREPLTSLQTQPQQETAAQAAA